MLQNIKELYGNKLAALDGDIGHVKDFYFDDKTWMIRYLVVDTGSWLTGRLVLLSPHAFGCLDRDEKNLQVNLTRKQIKNSPSIDWHQPVSRQYETDYHRYYGWPAYWEGGARAGFGGYPVVLPPSNDEREDRRQHHRDDKPLRSTKAVTGYYIQATDGAIGFISDLLVDDKSWAIDDLVVETDHWYSGREILISPARIERINYDESEVFANLTKTEIQQIAENELVKAVA